MTRNNASWTSFSISALGIWMLAAPATFGFESRALIWSDWISGALLFLFGSLLRRSKTRLLPWFIGIIGIWLQFSPLVFLAPDAGSYLNDTLVGALVIAFSLTIPKLPNSPNDQELSIPSGWSYNPSAWPQRIVIALLAFVCWMISRYLAAFELGYIDIAWDPFFGDGTERVLTSAVSKAFPVPDAGLGAFAYTLEFFSTCQGGRARWRTDPWLVLIFGILVIPVSFTSVCLIILQPLAVGAWCTLCLLTACCMLIAIPFAIGEVIAAIRFLRKEKSRPFFSLLFKGGFPKGMKKDTSTPDLDEPLWKLFQSALQGISFPWNLWISALLGIFLMALPWPFGIEGLLEDLDPIFGAFTAVFSVIAFSEIARNLRWINFVFALILFIATISSLSQLSALAGFLHLIVAVFIGLLSLRKGPIYEKSG